MSENTIEPDGPICDNPVDDYTLLQNAIPVLMRTLHNAQRLAYLEHEHKWENTQKRVYKIIINDWAYEFSKDLHAIPSVRPYEPITLNDLTKMQKLWLLSSLLTEIYPASKNES